MLAECAQRFVVIGTVSYRDTSKEGHGAHSEERFEIAAPSGGYAPAFHTVGADIYTGSSVPPGQVRIQIREVLVPEGSESALIEAQRTLLRAETELKGEMETNARLRQKLNAASERARAAEAERDAARTQLAALLSALTAGAASDSR